MSVSNVGAGASDWQWSVLASEKDVCPFQLPPSGLLLGYGQSSNPKGDGSCVSTLGLGISGCRIKFLTRA